MHLYMLSVYHPTNFSFSLGKPLFEYGRPFVDFIKKQSAMFSQNTKAFQDGETYAENFASCIYSFAYGEFHDSKYIACFRII